MSARSSEVENKNASDNRFKPSYTVPKNQADKSATGNSVVSILEQIKKLSADEVAEIKAVAKKKLLIASKSKSTVNHQSTSGKKFKSSYMPSKNQTDKSTKIETVAKKKVLVASELKSVADNQSVSSNGFKYSHTPSGIQIDKYLGNETYVTVPNEIEGQPVTNIGYRAFDNANLHKIAIPSSVKTIVYGAVMTKEPLKIYFQGSQIQVTSQSFIAPKIEIYFDKGTLLGTLKKLEDTNPKIRIRYESSFYFEFEMGI